MESWRLVWRTGFARVLPAVGLRALLKALADDDVTLAQGCTTTPPPLLCVQDWPVEAADAVGFAAWHALLAAGVARPTVGQVEEGFAKACFEADQLLGEPAACRWFLNFWDETPRPLAVASLRDEVGYNLGVSGDPVDAPAPAWSAVTPLGMPF